MAKVQPKFSKGEEEQSSSTSPLGDKFKGSLHQQWLVVANRLPPRVISFLVTATIGLGAIFPLTSVVKGQLLGLGFTNSKLLYFDSAPGISFGFLWLTVLIFFREQSWNVFSILAATFFVSTIIYLLVEHSAIPPSDEATLFIISIPTLTYVTFFSLRLRQYYLQGKLPKRKKRKDSMDDRQQ
eukprot:jgi/Galph1/1887/GphlegSOOS_G564.1